MIFLKEKKSKIHEILPEVTKESIEKNVTIVLRNAKDVITESCINDSWLNLKKYYCLTKEQTARSQQLIYFIEESDIDEYGLDVDVLKENAKKNLESTDWRKYGFIEYMSTKGSPLTSIVDVPKNVPMGFGFSKENAFPYVKGDNSIIEDFCVVTNRFNLNGSSFLCCTESMHKLYEQIGSFYIFASSKHETMCVKAKSIENRGSKVLLNGSKIDFAQKEISDISTMLNTKNDAKDILTQAVYFFGGDYLMKVQLS